MRVTAGEFKGRMLEAPKGVKIRPTSQKLRKALFDILGPRTVGSRFLELYAGSGAVGIEALSRGAVQAVFVENNRRCAKAIEANLQKLRLSCRYGLSSGLTGDIRAVILVMDSAEALRLLSSAGFSCDLLFLDPPYDHADLKNSLLKLADCDILNIHSLIIAEHSKRDAEHTVINGVRLIKRREYGDSILSFYEKEGYLPRDI